MEKALLLVDLIKGFGQEGYDEDMYCRNVEKIKGNLQRLVDYAKKNNMLVVYCCDSHEKDDPELKRNGGPWPDHCMRDTKGSEIVDWLPAQNFLQVTKDNVETCLLKSNGIQNNADSFRINKRAYSGFSNTPLNVLLKREGVEEVYIAGLVTSICVQHTAADAFFEGYKVNIVEDGCADVTDEKHENAITYMKSNYAAEVVKINQKTRLEKVMGG
jgi:nicotinamidase/pyrazinamidase